MTPSHHGYRSAGHATLVTQPLPPPPQDLILTNETEYTPWSSMRNGREGKRLGEVSVAANTDTRFKFRFADSNDTDGTPVAVAYGPYTRTCATLPRGRSVPTRPLM